MSAAFPPLGPLVAVPDVIAEVAVDAPPRPPLRWRVLLPQFIALLAVLALGGWLAHNAAQNLAARHVASGFGFLDDSAGFAISEGLIPYDAGDTYARAFAAGIANTLRAALPAVLLVSVLGFAVGIAQLSRHALLRWSAIAYVDLVRNVPLLVQVLLWYFALTMLLPAPESPMQWSDLVFLSKGGLAVAVPQLDALMAAGLLALSLLLPWTTWRLLGRRAAAWPLAPVLIAALWLLQPGSWDRPVLGSFGVTGGATLSPEWLALVGALTVYAGAYGAEIVRAGLQAVPRGQWEAAQALGLTRAQALRRVIVPQALRVIVPPFASLVMNTVKNSSLAVAIGYPDLVSVATTSLNQNGQAIECIAIIASVYLLLNLVIALAMGAVNAAVQVKER